MSDTAKGVNRDIGIIKETVFGKLPTSTADVVELLRTTGDTVKGSIETRQSNEFRKNRTTAKPGKGRGSAAGDISGEFSFGTFDTLFESFFRNTFKENTEQVYAVTTDIDGTEEANALEAHHTGQKKITFGKGETLVKPSSFTVIKNYTDIEDGLLMVYPGNKVNTFNVSIPVSGEATISFGLIGASAGEVLNAQDLRNKGANDADGSAGYRGLRDRYIDPATPTDTEVFNSFIGTLKIMHKGTNVTKDIAYATQLDMTGTNNSAASYAIFQERADSISDDKINITGTVTLYLKDKEFIASHYNWEDLKFVASIQDLDGNRYQFTIPNVVLTDAGTGTSASGDQTVAFPFTAFGDDPLQIYYIPAEGLTAVAKKPRIVIKKTGTAAVNAATFTLKLPEGAAQTGYAMKYSINGAPSVIAVADTPVPVGANSGVEYWASATDCTDSAHMTVDVTVGVEQIADPDIPVVAAETLKFTAAANAAATYYTKGATADIADPTDESTAYVHAEGIDLTTAGTHYVKAFSTGADGKLSSNVITFGPFTST